MSTDNTEESVSNFSQNVIQKAFEFMAKNKPKIDSTSDDEVQFVPMHNLVAEYEKYLEDGVPPVSDDSADDENDDCFHPSDEKINQENDFFKSANTKNVKTNFYIYRVFFYLELPTSTFNKASFCA